jgi:hypothetical protein
MARLQRKAHTSMFNGGNSSEFYRFVAVIRFRSIYALGFLSILGFGLWAFCP